MRYLKKLNFVCIFTSLKDHILPLVILITFGEEYKGRTALRANTANYSLLELRHIPVRVKDFPTKIKYVAKKRSSILYNYCQRKMQTCFACRIPAHGFRITVKVIIIWSQFFNNNNYQWRIPYLISSVLQYCATQREEIAHEHSNITTETVLWNFITSA
jgi:hypothetical protein